MKYTRTWDDGTTGSAGHDLGIVNATPWPFYASIQLLYETYSLR